MTERPIPTETRYLAEQVGSDPEMWRRNCHAASLAVVRSGLYPGARVARGTHPSVGGQHSWVVIGDPYDPASLIIDPTLWSYDDDADGVVRATGGRTWVPFGTGNIWQWGRPSHHGGATIEVDLSSLSPGARAFVEMLGPLDYKGWSEVAHAPVGGWPAREVHLLMQADDRLRFLAPIDVVGMLTDLNPGGVYLPRADAKSD